MPRPTLLVAETEPRQALSVRKLVLETGKFNVLTAHSTSEALDLFRMFPNISMLVLAEGEGINCETVAQAVRKERPKVPIVFLHPQISATCDYADYTLSSFEPEELIALARSVLGDPRN
jgi:DNA-binding response OmpR family regulator